MSYILCIGVPSYYVLCLTHRFSASEALAHPWITGEGHFETHQKHLLTASNSFRIHSTSRSHNTPTTPTHANNIPSPTSNSAAAAITPTAAAAAAATAAAVISSINSNKPTVSTKPTISIRSNSNSNKPSTSSTTTTANSSRMNTTNSSRNSVTSSSCSSSGSNLVSSTPRSPTRKPIRVGLPGTPVLSSLPYFIHSCLLVHKHSKIALFSSSSCC